MLLLLNLILKQKLQKLMLSLLDLLSFEKQTSIKHTWVESRPGRIGDEPPREIASVEYWGNAQSRREEGRCLLK